MSKKSDEFYFDNFIACASCALEASKLLDETLRGFDPATLPAKLDELHQIEHEADTKKHKLMATLASAFITPIEREDIISLSQNLDEVVDKLEDVLQRVYMNNVSSIRPEALEFTKAIILCADALVRLMKEFVDFKKSKTIQGLLVEVNSLEEQCDRLFMNAMRTLHTTCTDALEIIAWREIFIFLEKCADACEHAADVVESIVMKNT